jgi:hypothetical protein
MIPNAANPREPAASRRILILTAAVAVALTAVHIWVPGGSDWWPFAPPFGFLVYLWSVPFLIGTSVRQSQSRGPLIATQRGLAARTTGPREVAIGILLLMWSMVTCMAVDQWSDPDPSDPLGLIAAIGLTVWAVLLAVLAALFSPAAWHGAVIELSPAGIRERGLLYRRLIPWEALAADGLFRPPGRPGRVYLTVAYPDRVTQRGWAVGAGTRELPALSPVTHAHVLAEVIRWYVAEPAERSDIDTPAGRERLATHLAAVAAQAYAPLVHVPVGAVPTVRVPIPVRHPRATRLFVYLVVGAGLLVMATNLLATIVFRNDIRAGEQAALDEMALPPDMTPFFSADPVAYARTLAIAALVVTALVSVAMLALTPSTIRGSEPARVALAIILGVVGCLTACPCDWSGVMENPGTGMLFNTWVELRMLANFGVSVLAWTAFALVLTRAQQHPQAS